MRAYFALFRCNMRLTLRDRGVLFFNYLFPLIAREPRKVGNVQGHGRPEADHAGE